MENVIDDFCLLFDDDLIDYDCSICIYCIHYDNGICYKNNVLLVD